jgi:hypothetical protein
VKLGESFLDGLHEVAVSKDRDGLPHRFVVVGGDQDRGRPAVAGDLVTLVGGLRLGDQFGQPGSGGQTRVVTATATNRIVRYVIE